MSRNVCSRLLKTRLLQTFRARGCNLQYISLVSFRRNKKYNKCSISIGFHAGDASCNFETDWCGWHEESVRNFSQWHRVLAEEMGKMEQLAEWKCQWLGGLAWFIIFTSLSLRSHSDNIFFVGLFFMNEPLPFLIDV